MLRYNKQLLFRWVRRNQEGRSIDTFFVENHLGRIAFYYWNEMCELLYYELKDTDIQVTGVLDERTDLNIPLAIYSDVSRLPEVDAIVICTAMNSAKIEEDLRKQTKCLVFTLDDLL